MSEKGRGLVEDNDIFANRRAGVAILKEGAPLVKGNRIHDGRDSGVLVCEHGMGSVVNNEIFANFMAGVAIGHGGASTVKGNMIRDGSGGSLLCLSTQTRGLICANVIDQDASASLQVRPPPFESETAPPLHAAPLHTARPRGPPESNQLHTRADVCACAPNDVCACARNDRHLRMCVDAFK